MNFHSKSFAILEQMPTFAARNVGKVAFGGIKRIGKVALNVEKSVGKVA